MHVQLRRIACFLYSFEACIRYNHAQRQLCLFLCYLQDNTRIEVVVVVVLKFYVQPIAKVMRRRDFGLNF